MNPEHLSQLPEPVRATLAQLEAQFTAEDRQLEQAVLAALRKAHASARILAVCDALRVQHPTLTHRFIVRAAALFVGVNERYVNKLYYRRRG